MINPREVKSHFPLFEYFRRFNRTKLLLISEMLQKHSFYVIGLEFDHILN